MDLRVLAQLIERLRRATIGSPRRVRHMDGYVFEYEDPSAKVVAMLKLVRAARCAVPQDLRWHCERYR